MKTQILVLSLSSFILTLVLAEPGEARRSSRQSKGRTQQQRQQATRQPLRPNNCGLAPSSQALAKYKSCVEKKRVTCRGQRAALIDADKRCAWIIDCEGNQPQAFQSHFIHIGRASRGNPAKLGRDENHTPPGLMLTTQKTSSGIRRFQKDKTSFIPLIGQDSGNRRAYERGVYAHARLGFGVDSTGGCLGFDNDADFRKFQSALSQDGGSKNKNGIPNGIPIFVWGQKLEDSKLSGCDGKVEKDDGSLAAQSLDDSTASAPLAE